MNLQPVSPAAVSVLIRCGRCAGRYYVGRSGHKMFADLDGQPFVAYYCEACRAHLVVTTGGREGICNDSLRYGRAA